MSTGTNQGTGSGRRPDIAICGIGCIFPQAENLEAYWDNIKKGVNSITDVPKATHWSPEDYLDANPKTPDMTYAARGGFLSPIEFNPMEFGIAPKDIEATDTTQIFGLIAAKEALRDAGYWAGKHFDRSRTSVILGVTGTLELAIPLGARLGHPIWRRALRDSGLDEEVSQEVVERIAAGYVDWQENSFPGLLGNVAAGRIANRFDLGGTNCVVDAACASSLGALHLAELELTSGKADMVLTGGIDTFNDIFMYMCFSKTPALSPTGDAKPFSKDSDGTILGEGIGILVLKRLGDAERDGDKIYAVIKGIGASSDGKGNAIYAPSAKGQVKALRRAYEIAGVKPSTIELVEAHGTGTRVGDAVEVAALTEVYSADGRPGSWCALGSVKSQIGHTKAASGVAALIKVAMALHHRVLPPTIKVSEPLDGAAPGKSPFYVNTSKRPWVGSPEHPRRAGVSSFGFGGSNFHCVLEEAPHARAAVSPELAHQIMAFSGSDPGAILKKLESVPGPGKWTEVREFAARTRAAFDVKAPYRLFLVCSNAPGSLAKALASARRNLGSKPGSERWSTPEGAIFGRAESDDKLAMLFPGQGSQYVGMLRDLACQFGAFQGVFDGANFAFGADETNPPTQRLSDYIYPHPGFDKDAPQRQAEQLKQTRIAQPAIGAVCLGGFQVLREFGIEVDVVGGHSYGELVALQAAGRVDEATFHGLSNLRGRLMAEASQAREAGGMLVVKASLETVEELLDRENCGLVIANHNAPDQIVLAGKLAAIHKTSALFSDRSIWNRTLPVSAAFHSPLVANAREPFLARLKQAEIRAGRLPVFANSTADVYPDSADEVRTILAGQLAQPVRFVEQIQAMYDFGVRTFVEVGPGNVLSGLIKAILNGKETTVVSLDASLGRNDGMHDLAVTLCEIAASGHSVNLALWDEEFSRSPDRQREQKSKLSVPICGANQRSPRSERPPSAPRRNLLEVVSLAGQGVSVPPAASSPRAPHSATSLIPSARPSVPATRVELEHALQASRDGLIALQRLQEQTAELHRRFLEGQDAALRTFLVLLDQQKSIPGAQLPVSPEVSEALASVAAFTPPRTDHELIAPTGVAAVPVSAASAGRPSIAAVLMAVVAEKTGYPTEMLNLEMSLDSDLGIDSIKRVEIMSALQLRLPDAPEIKPEQLGSLITLQQVVSFLSQGVTVPPSPLAVAEAAPSADQRTAVSQALLRIVADKTGYPLEMLDLEMGLDSDLGIDSIKRVEIMSALQNGVPGLPEIKPEDLGTFQTLQHVVRFLCAGEPVASSVAAVPAVSASLAVSAVAASAQTLERLLVRPAQVAVDGSVGQVRLEPGAHIWLVDDETGLARQIERELVTLGYQVTRKSLAALRAQEIPERLGALIVLATPEPAHLDPIAASFTVIQRAGPALRRAARSAGSLLVTVSRMDGCFGLLGLNGLGNPVSGGLAGMTKTARHEWPEVHCRAIDLDVQLKDNFKAARAIVREIFLKGPVEVGISDQGRCTVDLQPIPFNGDPIRLPLASGDVVVVTGGGRGVTAQTAIALAQAFRPTLVLLGRSPVPEPEPDWLSSLTDVADIKRAIHAHLNEPPSLQEVESHYRRWMGNREVAANIRRMQQAGAKVVYRSLDIRDEAAVDRLFGELRQELGPIRGLIHGAGVLADRKIEDKTGEQFAQVYSTKVGGLQALLKSAQNDDLKIMALFSSFTGRYGRKGQVSYAAANEVLNKLAQVESQRRPGCRVVSVNWGPWNGGMVNATLRAMFEAEGVGLIEPQAGADYLVRELSVGSRGPVEVVVVAPSLGSRDLGRHEVPTAGEVCGPPPSAGESALELSISVARFPVLRSHVVNGKAVVPAALMVEWMAQGTLHGHPGMMFHGLDDFAVLKGIILTEEDTVNLSVDVLSLTRTEGGLLIPVQLVSRQSGHQRVHARARVLLGNGVLAPAVPRIANPGKPDGRTRAEIYTPEFLFHGSDLEGIEVLTGIGTGGIAATVSPAPKPSAWISEPLRQTWITEPLMLDCCFQLMILWSLKHQGAHSLPTGLAKYRQFVGRFPKHPMTIRIQITSIEQQLVRARMECLDGKGKVLALLDGYECVLEPSLKAAFTRNRLARLQQA
jgi:acyl transferase domain-containing protein/NAD(P)-dependent dehydrogenase (short-subunit alcohol dehydrogenase family)